MADVGNVADRWIWRGSTSTRKPSPPPPRLFSEVYDTAQHKTPSKPTMKSFDAHGSETQLSASPSSHAAHPGAVPGWMWSTKLVMTKTSGSWDNRGIMTPATLLVTEPSLMTNTTLLQDLTSPTKLLQTLSIHTFPSLTTVAQQYTRNMEPYDIPYLANKHVIARESQTELSHPSSLLVLSILVASLLVSLVANLVMLFAVLRRSYLRQTVFLLYLNLAASDLLASFLSVPVAMMVIFNGGSEERSVGGDGPSMGSCLLFNVAVVLMSYVSVGSIVGICTVRWCQFYNFSKTRGQERLVIRFFILFLWMTGAGIGAGLVIRQTVLGTVELTCTTLHLATILNDTLPFSTSSIVIGLILVVLVNHLTIRNLSTTDVCPYATQDTPSIRRYLMHLTQYNNVNSLHNNATSEQSSLGGYPKMNSDDVFDKPPAGQYLNENITASTDDKNSSTTRIERDTATTSINVGGCEKYASDMSCDLPTAISDRSCNVSSPVSARPPLPPIPTEDDNLNQEERVLRGVCQIKLESADNGGETDLESEHLYEIVEPLDVQEELVEGNSRRQQVQPLRHRVLLPNTIESKYNISPSVKRHQTTLVNAGSGPGADHTVNTSAWRVGDALTSETSHQVTRDHAPVIEEEELRDIKRGASTSSLQSSPSIKETPLSPLWLPRLPAMHSSRLSSKPHRHGHLLNQRTAARVGVEDSPSAGYLADMSAPSSRPSTPHHKLGRRQRAERIMAIARVRTISRQHSVNDSEDEEPNALRTVSQATTVRGRSCRPKLTPQGTLSDASSVNKINPVHLKCIRTSRCLSALYIVAYLPLLLLQILLYVLGGSTILLVTITYMSCLLAVHPCLYGHQTPLLRHAMYRVGKRPRTCMHSSRSQDGDAHL